MFNLFICNYQSRFQIQLNFLIREKERKKISIENSNLACATADFFLLEGKNFKFFFKLKLKIKLDQSNL
jgi:hypothetical protein